MRSGVGALRAALSSTDDTLVIAADIRTGPPNCPDESAAATPVPLSWSASPTIRSPTTSAAPRPPASSSTVGAPRRLPHQAVGGAVRREPLRRPRPARRGPRRSKRPASPPTTSTRRDRRRGAPACRWRSLAKKLRRPVAGDLAATVGTCRRRRSAGFCLAAALEHGRPRAMSIALVSLADGADVLSSGSPTRSRRIGRPARSPTRSEPATTACRTPSSWRGGRMLPPEPPRPARAGARVGLGRRAQSVDWKFGFVGSQGPRVGCGAPAAGPGELRRRQRRRHGAGPDGRRGRHGRHRSPSTAWPTRRARR